MRAESVGTVCCVPSSAIAEGKENKSESFVSVYLTRAAKNLIDKHAFQCTLARVQTSGIPLMMLISVRESENPQTLILFRRNI